MTRMKESFTLRDGCRTSEDARWPRCSLSGHQTLVPIQSRQRRLEMRDAGKMLIAAGLFGRGRVQL